MLGKRDRDRLDAIARELRAEDLRFYLAIEAGRPRAPREYRTRRRCMLLVLLAASPLFVAAVAVGNRLVFLVAVVFVSAGAALVQARSPDRPWHRRPDDRPAEDP
jgi:hypothetical protein